MSWRVTFACGVMAEGDAHRLVASDDGLERLALEHLDRYDNAAAVTPTGPFLSMPDERAVWFALLDAMHSAGYTSAPGGMEVVAGDPPDVSDIDTSYPDDAVS